MHVIFLVGIVLVCDYVHGGKGYLFEGGVGLLGGVGEKGGGLEFAIGLICLIGCGLSWQWIRLPWYILNYALNNCFSTAPRSINGYTVEVRGYRGLVLTCCI